MSHRVGTDTTHTVPSDEPGGLTVVPADLCHALPRDGDVALCGHEPREILARVDWEHLSTVAKRCAECAALATRSDLV